MRLIGEYNQPHTYGLRKFPRLVWRSKPVEKEKGKKKNARSKLIFDQPFDFVSLKLILIGGSHLNRSYMNVDPFMELLAELNSIG